MSLVNKMKMDLVSLVIATYNSSKVVVQTLDSIFNQTYKNIELIIQDDCSPDDTVQVINEWIEKRNAEERFVNIIVSQNPQNIGTAKNFDIGCSRACGKWIKILGGDDMLFPDCIEKNVSFAEAFNEDILVVSETVDFFFNEAGEMEKRPGGVGVHSKYLKKFNRLNASKQYKKVLRNYRFPAPTFFFSQKGLIEIGGFDTRYGLMEDWPLIIRWTKSGKAIRYLDEPTVFYRVGAPKTEKGGAFFLLEHEKRIQRLKEDEIYPNISKLDFAYWVSEKNMAKIRKIMVEKYGNVKTPRSTMVFYLLTWLVPRYWPIKIRLIWQNGFRGLKKRQKWNLR